MEIIGDYFQSRNMNLKSKSGLRCNRLTFSNFVVFHSVRIKQKLPPVVPVKSDTGEVCHHSLVHCCEAVMV